jgi:hypothetical protein
MRHRPFKDLQGLSHDDAISFLQRIPVTCLRCYRDMRLRDDTERRNSVNNRTGQRLRRVETSVLEMATGMQ